MKTLIISDIHIDINKEYDVIGELAKYSSENTVECIIIAGDISENIELTIPALDRLEKLSEVQVLFVPGNHDMWEPNKDNDRIYERYCSDPRCICGKPRQIGEHIVIGDIGWYDYSFGNHSKYEDSDFERMQLDGRTWNDKNRNSWTDDNKAKSQWFIDRLERQIIEHDDKPIVVVTHMLPHKVFAVPPEEYTNIDWNYFNAFLGTDKLSKMYEKHNVKYAVCGHVHFRFDHEENGVTYMCRCLNYEREWRGQKDCAAQIKETAEIVFL